MIGINFLFCDAAVNSLFIPKLQETVQCFVWGSAVCVPRSLTFKDTGTSSLCPSSWCAVKTLQAMERSSSCKTVLCRHGAGQDCLCYPGSGLCDPGAQQCCDCCVSGVENAQFIGFVVVQFLAENSSLNLSVDGCVIKRIYLNKTEIF